MNRHERRAQKAQRRGVFHPCNATDLAEAVAVCEAAGQIGHAELLREMRKGRLALVAGFGRRDPIAAADLETAPCATVVVVSDDDYASTGPAGWRSAEVVMAWARTFLIHASAFDRESYRAVAQAARVMGRAALIETSSEHAEAWARLVKDKPGVMILPTNGLHPVVPRREKMH